MQLTPTEALDLLRIVSESADRARAAWDRAREDRDALIRELDGQEGMARTAMAEACGITRMALWKLLDRHESVEEDVLLSDALREAIEQVLESADVSDVDRLHLDVHA